MIVIAGVGREERESGRRGREDAGGVRELPDPRGREGIRLPGGPNDRHGRPLRATLAGVGAGHVRQRYFLVPAFFSADRPEFTRSSLTPVVSVGGGADFSIARRFAAGVDVRSLHLLDDEVDDSRFITPAGTLSTIRVGARIVYRF